MKRNTAKTKLIATIISIVSALCLLAVGVFATLTNFQVAIANQLSLKFDAVEGTLYATRLGDVAGTDRTTSKVLSESTTATDWLKVYDGTTTEGVQNDALTSIQEKVDFISNDAIKAKVNAGTTSIAITYYFYYTLPTNAVSNDVVLTAPAVADGNVAVTYSYVKGTGATLPDFTSGTVLTNGETVQVAGGEHLFIKAEAKVDLSKSVKIENANWNFTLNFGISKYTLTGDTLNFKAVSGAETYEVWAKETTTSGASLLAQTSAVGDTDATLGTLKKILNKDTTSLDLKSALAGLNSGAYLITVLPKNASGVEIAGSRVAVKYTLVVPKLITLTFRCMEERTLSGGGINRVTQNGTEITSLEVESGLTLKQILANYSLTLESGHGNITASYFDGFYSKYWDKGTNLNITFTENTTITFFYAPCLEVNTEITVYDEKKKKYVNKKLKDITYSDLILVWNFDKGDFDPAKPLWISNTKKATSYTVVEFSDGTSVKFVGPDETKRHRIFNVDTGTFEYIGINTKVGTRTFNSKGEVVTITKLTNREEQVEFANLITYYHFNCFANGILTSCRLNNLYEIKDMKYVKDNRTLASRKDYLGVPDEYYYGLRLSEQLFTDKANTGDTRFSSLHEYVEQLMATAKQK